jgi:hypothetical protein
MRADLNLATPTSKQAVIDGLRQIDEYYKYRKDEYVPPVLVPLNLERMQFTVKSDSEYLSLAEELLKSKHTEDIRDRKDYFSKELWKVQSEMAELPSKLAEELSLLEEKYDELVNELKTEYRLKGIAYGDGSNGALAVLLNKKAEENAEITQKYAQKEQALDILVGYYSTEIDGAEQFFAKEHSEEINAKAIELKESDLETEREVHKYNEGLLEREVKYNNTLEQSAKKLHMEYMKIVYEGMTSEELLQKGYFHDALEWVLNYYRNKTDKVAGYIEYTETTDYILYLKDFYEQGVRLLYTLAYGV